MTAQAESTANAAAPSAPTPPATTSSQTTGTPAATATATTATTATTTADDRATQFQAVEGGAETHSGGTLLVEAYALIWVILMGYLVMLWRKQALLNGRLDDLDCVLDKAAAKSKTKR